MIDIIKKHNIVVLQGVAAYSNRSRKEKWTIHAVGDGTFITDGRRLNRRKLIQKWIPEGI